MQESCVARRKFLNLVTWDVSTFRLSPTRDCQETQGDRSVRQIPRPPFLIILHFKKCHKITFSSISRLPIPKIWFSPSYLHFSPDFSLLPILFDFVLNRNIQGYKLTVWQREAVMAFLIQYLHLDKDYPALTKPALYKSVHAFIFQMLRKISFLHQNATLRMYTGDFKKLAPVCVVLSNWAN